VAIRDGRFLAVGDVEHVMRYREAGSQVIDLNGRTAIPGLNDSHIHLIRGGLNYNLELRWEGVPSLADALRMLKEQAGRTPHPQWVRVVGGWSAFQFAERRMPTLEEINAAAPDTPVFVLHLYDRALLNRAALRAVGYTKDTPNPSGGEIQVDAAGNPTGMLIARPNAMILYATLARGPTLPRDLQVNSTRQFMRELNRLGLTSAIDAGGGFQNYPDDYAVIEELDRNKQLTIRIAYNLFTQNKGRELEDFQRWTGMVKPGAGSDYYRHNGAGEMLVFSAADFEDFLEPRPDLAAGMEAELEKVVRHLVSQRWPFRLHATYDESISRMLDVFEKVNREIPFDGLHWMFDHAETITPRNIDPRARARRRHRDPAPHGVPGRVLRRALRRRCGQGRRRSSACWRPACRWAPAPTPPAWPATIRGPPCTGWCPAAPSAGCACTTPAAACRATPRWNCGPPAARGSPASRARRGASRKASWPTWRCSAPTFSASTRKRSRRSNRC
jgi:predicted amidohydrolase YtcJ